MISFDKLVILNKHINYLNGKINKNKTNKKSLFIVGWWIRDLLLGIVAEPDDVDATMGGEPTNIYKKIDKTNISHFITEKYWTITIIPKEDKNIQYEITPFRKEAWYDDKRHPTEIEWTSDLLMDVKRREFTISSLYYFSQNCTSDDKTRLDLVKNTEETPLLLLKQYGFAYINKNNLWVIQDNKIIDKLFNKWDFDSKELENLKKHWNKIRNKEIIFPSEIQILIDPVFWLQDMIDGRLTAVGLPDARFQEDALRIIRALRFINVINTKLSQKEWPKHYFDIEKETWNSIKKNFYLIQHIAKERLKIELDKVFRKWNPFGFIALLDETNMLKFLFPNLYSTKHVDQPVRYHPFDVYHHTILALFYAQQKSKNPLVRYATLYHDVGKVDQYYLYWLWLDREEVTKIADLNHRNSSSVLAKKDFGALWFSNKNIEEICRYINNHHKPEEILSAKPKNQEKKLRKLLSEAWIERLLNLFDVVLWDRLWHFNPVQPPEIDEIEYLIDLSKKLHKKEGQFTISKLAISGNDIMKEFGIEPSKQIGELLEKAFDRVINDIATRNTLKKIISYIKTIH